MRDLTHLSLFSGIGGLDLAAEWSGFRTVGQCEWADYPTKVLEKHWPEVPRWRDIRTLTNESFFERTGLRTVDIISGGFPCQPFSVAGKRRGEEDDRYLWPEMLRVIQEIRPAWVVGENVAGIVSMVKPVPHFRVESRTINRFPNEDHYEAVLSRQEDALFVSLLEDLERIGYEVQPFIIPACAVDAPHRRDRIAIVAYTDKNGCLRSGSKLTVRRNTNQKYSSVTKSRNVSNTHSQRLQIPGFEPGQQAVQTENGTEFCRGRPTQSGLGGMADGLPHWMDDPLGVPRIAAAIKDRVNRLKCLGNAVVPQQFYPIFRIIAQIEMDGIAQALEEAEEP